jgi:hypothetical protein
MFIVLNPSDIRDQFKSREEAIEDAKLRILEGDDSDYVIAEITDKVTRSVNAVVERPSWLRS